MYRKYFLIELRVFAKVQLVIALLLLAVQGISQPTRVTGKLTDKETGKAIIRASVVFKNTSIGVLTDSLGFFQLSSKQPVDSVHFSIVGYISKTIGIRPSATTELSVSLNPDLVEISEIQIVPDDGHQSVFKTDADSSRYLPIYFSEQLVFNEFQRNPSAQKSTVLADRTTGVGVLDDYEISGYTSALDMEVNFYDNFINLFTQNFVSPLADNGWFYYKYFLADSTMQNGRKQYKISFIPRRAGDKVFKGFLTTDNKDFSLLEVDGTLASTSYLNFLKSIPSLN